MHFTYCEPSSAAVLQQGDVLARTSRLNEVLSRAFPYYTKTDYVAFMVLTQTCDLVQEGRELKANYITLYAVRPLEAALAAEARRHQRDYVLRLGNVVTARGAGALRNFVERLLNNNDEEYFYLHPDASLPIADRSCAFVRLSIALRAEHYGICLEARRASLKPEFQAKLGWHVGKVFNRVATEDWQSTPFKQEVEGILKTHVIELEEKKVKVIRETKTEDELLRLPDDQIREMVRQVKLPSRKEEVIRAALASLSDGGLLRVEDSHKAFTRLNNDAVIKGLVKG